MTTTAGLFPDPTPAYPDDLARTLADWRGSGPTFDGLTIVALGDDGEMFVAAGHVDPARFLAAVLELDRWFGGGIVDEHAGWVEQVRHVEAAVVPHCGYPDDPDDPDDPEGHPPGCNCDGPWVSWAAGTPEPRYPATILDVS